MSGATDTRILSLGAGVQSSTLLLMAVHGELALDRAIFADTQWEPKAVYDWLETLVPLAERAGIPVDVVTAGDIRADTMSRQRRFASLPVHVTTSEGRPGMLRRQCSKEYKVRPVQRRLRALDATATHPVTLSIGISLEEAHRMRDSRVRYVRHEYPLVDRRMTRHDCLRWLDRHGYPEPPKSACIGCPYTDNRRWREMREQRPDEWQQAVEFDAVIRHLDRIDGTAYLHRSLVPLIQVDLSTPQDKGQLSFDDISDGECGAFSCFSAEEAVS